MIRSGARYFRACSTRRDDGVGGVDLAGLAAHAAEADFDVLGKLLEDGHVAGAGRGELHRDVADFEAAELLEDRVVAAAMVGFAAGAGTGSAAEVDGELRRR